MKLLTDRIEMRSIYFLQMLNLTFFLVSRGDSGIQIMSWYHRQFREAAEDRYTSDPAVNHVLHTGIADYFLGRWAGGKIRS